MIDLPWPPSILNPNRIAHWTKKAEAKKQYRNDCFWLAKSIPQPVFADGKINISLIFHPPDNRKRDDDNYISAFKSGRDGIADAWGIDDHRFRITTERGEVIKGGCVKVRLI